MNSIKFVLETHVHPSARSFLRDNSTQYLTHTLIQFLEKPSNLDQIDDDDDDSEFPEIRVQRQKMLPIQKKLNVSKLYNFSITPEKKLIQTYDYFSKLCKSAFFQNGLSSFFTNLEQETLKKLTEAIKDSVYEATIDSWRVSLLKTIEYIDSKLAFYKNQESSKNYNLKFRSVEVRIQAYCDKLHMMCYNSNYFNIYNDRNSDKLDGSNNHKAEAAEKNIDLDSFNQNLNAITILLKFSNRKLIPNKLKKKIQEEMCVLTLGCINDLDNYHRLVNLISLYCTIPKLIKITPIPVLEILEMSTQLLICIIVQTEPTKNLKTLRQTYSALCEKIQKLHKKTQIETTSIIPKYVK